MAVEYDGTDFHGFAAQPEQRTVQGALTDALERLLGCSVKVTGAGRTDAGVHAKGQVVDFATEASIPAKRVARAINRLLPIDLKAIKAWDVAEDFSARFSAKSRIYRYRLYTGRRASVWKSRYACWFPYEVDAAMAQTAAEMLVGEKDFRAFCADWSERENFVREIYRVEVRRKGSFIDLELEGTAFMKGMVRLIAGAVFLVGRGSRSLDWMGELVANSRRASLMMPPQGLCLMKVRY